MKKASVTQGYLGFEEPQNDTPGRNMEGSFHLFCSLGFSFLQFLQLENGEQ